MIQVKEMKQNLTDQPKNAGQLKRAFTLIELMIAIAIMMVIMAVLTWIFVQVSQAANRGIGEGKMLANALMFSDRIYDDANNMIPPGAGGHLAIMNAKKSNLKVTPRGATVSEIRIDQFYFMRYRGDLNPLTSKSDADRSPDIEVPADLVQVWYGHTTLVDTTDSDKNVTLDDMYAMNWHLGRQAIFFAGASYSGGRSATSSTAATLAPATKDVISQDWVTVLNSLRSNSATYPGTRFYNSNELKVRKSLAKVDNTADVVTLDLTSISADETSQMHPSFLDGAGHFEVGFAGDFDNDGYVDVDTDGSIKWYDAYTSGFVITVPTGRDAAFQPSIGGSTFSWHPDDYGPDSLWPSMVRVRYRMYSPSNQFEDDTSVPKMPMEHIFKVRQLN